VAILIYLRGLGDVERSMMGWRQGIYQIFRRSKRVHVRESNVHSLRQAIELIDRFIDNKLAYPLEWDDFISWSNANPSVEQMRNLIANLEPLFFSKEKEKRESALGRLIDCRNEYASRVGLAVRTTRQEYGVTK
jgi:hypothetical protein